MLSFLQWLYVPLFFFAEWQYTRKVHCATPLCLLNSPLPPASHSPILLQRAAATSTLCLIVVILPPPHFVWEWSSRQTSERENRRGKAELKSPLSLSANDIFQQHFSCCCCCSSPLKGESVPLLFEVAFITGLCKLPYLKVCRNWMVSLSQL